MNKKNSDRERRKDLRVGMPKPLMVRFRIEKQKGIFKLRPKKIARAKNMSVGGMFLELPHLQEGQLDRIIKGKDKLILELETPEARRPIRIKGKITRLEKRDRYGKPIYVAGISFEDIKEKDREEILRRLITICLKSGCSINY